MSTSVALRNPDVAEGFVVPSFLHPFHSVAAAYADNYVSPLHLADE